MSDPQPPSPAELDELASAHLDGATTAEEAARIDADPTLRARVEALRTVRDELRAAAAADRPVDAARRDATIAAALEHADDPLLAEVTPIAAASARRRRPAIKWVAAAALLVAAAGRILVGMDFDDSGSGDDDSLAATTDEESSSDGDASRTAADAESDAAGGAAADAALPTTTAEMSAPMTAMGKLQDLGPFPDVDAMADAVRAALSPTEPPRSLATDEANADGERCMGELSGEPEFGGKGVASFAVAQLGTVPVALYIVDEPDGSRLLLVVDPAPSCRILHRVTL